MSPDGSGMKRFVTLLLPVWLVSSVFSAQEEKAPKKIVSLSEQFKKQRNKSLPKQYIEVDEDAVNRTGMMELKIGQAPTKEHLQALEDDMVWIKEEEIAGFKMFFPVVYLAEKEEKEVKEATEKRGYPKRRRRRTAQ